MNGVRVLQLKEKEILEAFVAVCDKCSLKYYLAYGTLLGAKRHGGFIPWDDDVDVAMPRDDFERFTNEFYKLLPQELRFKSYKLQKDYHSYVPRIESGSVFVKDSSGAEYPAWIDIFPIDGMPPRRTLKHAWHKARLSIARAKMNLARLQDGVDFLSSKRSKMENALISFAKILRIGAKYKINKELDALDKLLKKYDPGITGNSVDFCGEKFKDECPYSFYGDGRTLVFEGTTMSVPAETEKMLEMLYGDYMQLPPVEERNVHKIMEIKEGSTL